jgi:pyruvate dehydrogenase E1 component
MYGNRAGEGEDIFYYLTLYNENYPMPPRPDHVEPADIVSGIYQFSAAGDGFGRRATILFSGSAQGAARAAQEELASRWGVGADLYSVTSYKHLRQQALGVERENRLRPGAEPEVPYITRVLQGAPGPVIAVTDFMKLVPDMVGRWIPHRFVPLGTDGFGHSDTRQALRAFFEVDMPSIVVATLSALAEDGVIEPALAQEAITHYGIDPYRLDPADPMNLPRPSSHALDAGRRAGDGDGPVHGDGSDAATADGTAGPVHDAHRAGARVDGAAPRSEHSTITP